MVIRARVRSLGFVLLALLAAGCGGDAGPEIIVIKFPHVTAPATPKGQTAERFKTLVEARFPGRVRVEVYPSAQLMEARDAVEALAFGEVQLIADSLSIFERFTTKFRIFDLPFLFPDLESVEEFQHSVAGHELLDALADKGIEGLTFWHNGMKQWSGPRPMRDPSDVAGLKIRIMESDVLMAQVEALDASPQKMAFSEVYQALQTGTVDAQENTWSNMYSQKFYEVQPYITETNHGYLGYFVATNAAFWDGLPDDIRSGLEEILADVTEWGNARASAINAAARQSIIDSGRTEIVTLTSAERRAWRDAMLPVWDRFRHDIGPDLVDEAAAISAAP
jgi:C4-dicarboxylate-binding protein DctP